MSSDQVKKTFCIHYEAYGPAPEIRYKLLSGAGTERRQMETKISIAWEENGAIIKPLRRKHLIKTESESDPHGINSGNELLTARFLACRCLDQLAPRTYFIRGYLW